jgi:predicted esterase
MLTLSLLAPGGVWAEVVTLRNGMQFEGSVGKIASLGEDPLNPRGGGAVKAKQIVFVDDDLRRTFFSQIQTQSVIPKQTPLERIRIEQRVAKGNRRVGAVGPIISITPFDEWGRRVFSMNTGQGPIDVIQGITEVTPIYCKVEGLQARHALVWDMRVATSSIPRETLSKVLLHTINPRDADDRLRVVRLYIQAERFNDAREELQTVIKAFPALADLQKQVQSLQQLSARRLIDEIKLRKSAGQHLLACNLLDRFPSEGQPGEILVQVREMLEDYQKLQKQREDTMRSLEGHFAALPDGKLKTDIAPLLQEIKAELNINTFDRLADYLRFAGDEKMPAEQKVALAISGWLLGNGSGTENLAVATSLAEVRQLVLRYLRSAAPLERDQLLQDLQSLEGSAPSYLAKLLAHIKPAVETPPPAADGPPGFYELQVPGLSESPEITYFVQLPPEYEPHRRYPAIVTLNGAGTTPAQQIDWWAGAYNAENKLRLGQGARHGYIVIAPQWTKPHQLEYEFSAREHAAVLYSLRDACRRFSVDTDRVFLSGHSLGGDAAWDIALAHPDLWAGVIPVVAVGEKYVVRYSENGRMLPFYFVAGELDGDKIARNGGEWDRYLTRHTYDVIIVVYEGRGHEHFQDEIHRLFQWMQLHRRNFFPKKFESVTMRPWDNFFWWAELEDIPSNALVLPANWPPEASTRPITVEGSVLENNRVTLKTGAGRATVWLAPEMVDFSKRIAVTIKGRERTTSVEPSLQVLLEDVRTRGDRQHPFWAKVDMSSSR